MTAADRGAEVTAPVTRHERVDDGVNATVEVRHDVKHLPHRLQVPVVHPLDEAEGDEKVVDEGR